jgi:hypothetical protein
MRGRSDAFRRAGVLAVAAVLIPACSSQSIQVAPFLLAEGFNGSFPGTNWTAATLTGSAAAAIDSGSGEPAPSLKMSTTAATASASTDTRMSFSNPTLTISVFMADLAGAATDLGTGTVSVVDATPAVVASARWDNASGLITFHINGGAADATVAAASDGAFHRLVFHVSSMGLATWSFDNGAALVTQAGFPPGMLKVRLGATFGTGTAWPAFFFDDVNVTSP